MLYDIESFKKRDQLNEGFWDGFTNRDVLEDYPGSRRRSAMPTINVIENNDEFILELASPGMCKEDYLLKVEDDILTITGNRENAMTERKYNRREFYTASFERSFLLPEYVDRDAIAASCADGILTIHIPKTENRTPKKRTIDIS